MSRGVITDITGDESMLWSFYCPGCRCSHFISKRWKWDGNREAPTVTPSILVRYDGRDAGVDGAPPAVCHLYVTAGQLQFLSDCTHDLAGKTVPMEPE